MWFSICWRYAPAAGATRSSSCLAADSPAWIRLPPRCPRTTQISNRLPITVGHSQSPSGVGNLRQEGGDAAGDLTGDEHRDVVRGRQQDRHEGIPLGELLAGADIDNRLAVAAPLGVHDIVLTNDESRAAVARAQRVVLEHDVCGHHLCDAG